MDVFLFILELIGLVAANLLIAVLVEKFFCRKTGQKFRGVGTREIAMVGVFSAASAVLMLVEIPLPFAPPFYKLDLSEIPVLILSFAYGPVAGVLCEMLKVLLKVLFKGTDSAFVGELANFVVGCSFVLPAGICYSHKKTRKTAILGCVLGTVVMTVFGSFLNGVYLLPTFAKIYGIPLESIVAMGTAIQPSIHSVTALVLLCVVPFNILKGTVDTVITVLLYKPLSKAIKTGKAR